MAKLLPTSPERVGKISSTLIHAMQVEGQANVAHTLNLQGPAISKWIAGDRIYETAKLIDMLGYQLIKQGVVVAGPGEVVIPREEIENRERHLTSLFEAAQQKCAALEQLVFTFLEEKRNGLVKSVYPKPLAEVIKPTGKPLTRTEKMVKRVLVHFLPNIFHA